MNQNLKIIISSTLSAVIALVFMYSAYGKLSGNESMKLAVGGASNAVLLGVSELIFLVLFLIPRTSIIGSLFLMCYMGGAMAVHFVKNENIIFQTIIQSLVWIVSFIRHPELKERLIKGTKLS
jgi:hypothetical protein